jgi:hypothetical protein
MLMDFFNNNFVKLKIFNMFKIFLNSLLARYQVSTAKWTTSLEYDCRWIFNARDNILVARYTTLQVRDNILVARYITLQVRQHVPMTIGDFKDNFLSFAPILKWKTYEL